MNDEHDNDRMTAPHPEPEEVGRYADGMLPKADQGRMEEHLAGCPRCFGLYAELTETYLSWRSGKVDPPPEEARRLGLAVARRLAPSHPRARSRRGSLFRMPRVLVPAGAAAALVGAALVFGVPGKGGVPAELLDPVRAALADQSARGFLFTADLAAEGATGPSYRSGTGTAEALEESVDGLNALVQERPRSEKAAYWRAAAVLAGGDLSSAATFLEDARRRYPENVDLALLQAGLLYRESRLSRCEQVLREILAVDGRHLLALGNLALVLEEQGRGEEAAGVRKTLEGLGKQGELLSRRPGGP